MVIKTKDIPVYYLNPDFFEERRKKMDIYLNEIGLKYERVPSNSKAELRQVRINEGLIKVVNTAILNNSFPFLILEDDARLTKDLPEEMIIPEESSIIYIGCSLYECGGKKGNVKIKDYDDNYYRLYNSLGTHAIIITSKAGADFFIKKQVEAIENNDYSDIYLAVSSNEHLILTPKDGPYFYQNDAHTEPITRFLWEDLLNKNYLI
jgi:hypothetical protein